MKKFILFAAILFAGVSVVNAQEQATNVETETVNTTLKVELHGLLSIRVNQALTTLVYDSSEDYDNVAGVSFTQPNHLTVSSTSGFTVNVRASELLTNATSSTLGEGTDTGIKITTKTGTEKGATIVPSTVSLKTTKEGETIIDSDAFNINNNYDITYTGKGSELYRSNYKSTNGGPDIYETTVYYTINAK